MVEEVDTYWERKEKEEAAKFVADLEERLSTKGILSIKNANEELEITYYDTDQAVISGKEWDVRVDSCKHCHQEIKGRAWTAMTFNLRSGKLGHYLPFEASEFNVTPTNLKEQRHIPDYFTRALAMLEERGYGFSEKYHSSPEIQDFIRTVKEAFLEKKMFSKHKVFNAQKGKLALIDQKFQLLDPKVIDMNYDSFIAVVKDAGIDVSSAQLAGINVKIFNPSYFRLQQIGRLELPSRKNTIYSIESTGPLIEEGVKIGFSTYYYDEVQRKRMINQDPVVFSVSSQLIDRLESITPLPLEYIAKKKVEVIKSEKRMITGPSSGLGPSSLDY